jgi:hypothetical protein
VRLERCLACLPIDSGKTLESEFLVGEQGLQPFDVIPNGNKPHFAFLLHQLREWQPILRSPHPNPGSLDKTSQLRALLLKRSPLDLQCFCSLGNSLA